MSATETTAAKKKLKLTPERLAANRANAKKSTGPRTPEGKAVSRLNGLKHGLSARLPLLPGEDAEDVQRQMQVWAHELKVQGDLAVTWLEQAVSASRAMERGRTHEAEAIAQRMGEAARAWDRDRDAGVKRHIDALKDDPAAASEGLKDSTTGCLWMIGRWEMLRADLDDVEMWAKDQKDLALRLLGVRPKEFLFDPLARAVTLAYYHAKVNEPTDVDDFVSCVEPDLERGQIYQVRNLMQEWLNQWPADHRESVRELAELADGQLALLRERVEELRPLEELRRAGAADAAMLDDPKAVSLRLRYAATHHRLLRESLREIRLLRDEANGHYRPRRRPAEAPPSGPSPAAPTEATGGDSSNANGCAANRYGDSDSPVSVPLGRPGWLGAVSSALPSAGEALRGAFRGLRPALS